MDEQTLESNLIAPAGDPADSLYQQSLVHFQNGRWQQAITGFEEVLRLRPDHAAAQAFLEETKLKASLEQDKPQPKRIGFPRAARRLLLILLSAAAIVLLVVGTRWAYSHWVAPQRATQLAQVRETQEVEKALKLLADRDYAAAEEAFRALLVKDPDNQQLQKGLEEAQTRIALSASYAKAEAAIAAQDWNEAARLLRTIIAQDPRYATAGAKLAYVEEQQNLSAALDKAEKAYLAGNWQEAIASYAALRSSNADYQKATVTGHLFESYLNQGMHLVRSTKGSADAVREAKALFEKALTLRPQQLQAMQEITLVDKYLEGHEQLAKGNLEAAQAALEWVCQQRPDYADGNAAMLLRISKGEAPIAPTPTLPVPTPAAPISPESQFQREYASALQQGDGAFGAGDYAQAEAAYRQATIVAIHGGLDAARWLFVAYVQLGTTYAKRGNNEAAVPAIKTAIAVMTQSATAIPSTDYADYVERGDSYAQSKDYANAFVQYDQAIRAIGRKCNCGLEGWSVVP